jgi:hypothetical protein
MKVILHMPYMFRAVNNPGYNFSRDTCFEAARGVVRCAYIMRTAPSVQKLGGCDFLSFVGCVTLLLGLLGYGCPENNQSASANDWALIEATLELFRGLSNRPFDKVAAQCYKALVQLVEFGQRSVKQPSAARVHLQVVVPFFGTITIRSGRPQESPVQSSALGSVHGVERTTIDLGHLVSNQSLQESARSTRIAYDGPYIHSSMNKLPVNESNVTTQSFTSSMDLQLDDYLQVCKIVLYGHCCIGF